MRKDPHITCEILEIHLKNKWIKKLVHLHNGILHSRKKDGTPTLHNSMDGSGEHYAK